MRSRAPVGAPVVARRFLVAALLATLSLAVAAGPARADGDPASDTLLYTNLFVPYSQAVSPPLTRQLVAALAEAKRSRRPVKVAVIAAPQDLGAVAGLWGKPEDYARFLGQEIAVGSLNKVLLVVVMPAGFGLYSGPTKSVDAEHAKLRGLKPGRDADMLARGALDAVARLTGVHVSSSRSQWRDRVIIVLGAAVALLVVAALALVGSRLRARRPQGAAEGETGA